MYEIYKDWKGCTSHTGRRRPNNIGAILGGRNYSPFAEWVQVLSVESSRKEPKYQPTRWLSMKKATGSAFCGLCSDHPSARTKSWGINSELEKISCFLTVTSLWYLCSSSLIGDSAVLEREDKRIQNWACHLSTCYFVTDWVANQLGRHSASFLYHFPRIFTQYTSFSHFTAMTIVKAARHFL